MWAQKLEPSINLKMFLDGEEERGSPHVEEILLANRQLLDADLWVFCDGPMHQTRHPQVVFGVRGVTSVEITAFGPAVALHSGHYGNWAPDPGMQLARVVASMRDANHELAVAGINARVQPLSATARRAIESSPSVEDRLRDDLALGWTEGEPASLGERISKPAVNLLGFSVGQVGARATNAISPTATAVVGFRLVPDLTPTLVRDSVEARLRALGYLLVHSEPDLELRRTHGKLLWLEWEDGYPALWTDMELPVSRKLVKVVKESVDGPVVLTPSMGGSLPLTFFSEALGGPPIVVLPIANHDNNQHAANENLRLANLWQGIEIYAGVLAKLKFRIQNSEF